MYDYSARFVTEQTSGIQLQESTAPLKGEVYTIYTSFERAVHSSIAFCAEIGFLRRITQRMMRSEEVDLQDVEDFSKEFFNVLCGHIAGALFRETKAAVRFQIPSFYPGQYQPQAREKGWELCYRNEREENARLIYYKAPNKEG